MTFARKSYLSNIQNIKISDSENSSSWRVLRYFAAVLVFSASLTLSAHAQIPPASQFLPEGFQVVTEINRANLVHIEAKKSNSNFPKPHMDRGIVLAINWNPNPGATRILEMVASQPQDSSTEIVGVARDEPVGKLQHKSGVLEWRKIITPWVGSGDAPDLVTLNGSWIGVFSDGLLGISISNFTGSKEQALIMMDSVLEHVTRFRRR